MKRKHEIELSRIRFAKSIGEKLEKIAGAKREEVKGKN